MKQPPDFGEEGKEDWVMDLSRGIYGMKQASQIWNKNFPYHCHKMGIPAYAQRMVCLQAHIPHGTTIFAIHVDNIIITSSSTDETSHFKEELRSQWEILDLGPAKFALGITISRDLANKTISISQTAFIDCIIDKFNQTAAHPCNTPMIARSQLRFPDKSLPIPPDIALWMRCTPYREPVGSLNYLAIATHPDIAYAIGCLASFLDCYQEEHWNAAIQVLCYIKETHTLLLVLGGDTTPSLSGYLDSNYANCYDTSHSITGYSYSLGLEAISWSSKKQKHIADSLCYAEYIALYHAGKEVIFLHELLDCLGFLFQNSMPLHCDNNAV